MPPTAAAAAVGPADGAASSSFLLDDGPLLLLRIVVYSDEVLHSLMEAAAEAASVYLQYIRSLDGSGNGSGGLTTPHGPRGTL